MNQGKPRSNSIIRTAPDKMAKLNSRKSIDSSLATESFSLSQLSTSRSNSLIDLWRATAKKFGLGLALLGGSLSLSPLHKADAGIITSSGSQASAQSTGANATVDSGGNLVWLNVVGDGGPAFTASGIATNYQGHGRIIGAGHTGLTLTNPLFTIGTGSNFNTNPGQTFTASSFSVFPGFTGTSSLGTSLDLMIIDLPNPIPNAPELVFAQAPLAFGDSVNLAGFGILGVFNQGVIGQTGDAYGGSSLFLGGSTLLNANPAYYTTVRMDLSDPFALGGATNDSGGWAYKIVDGKFITYGMLTHASTPTNGRTTQFLRMDEQNLTFHDYYSLVASVPESSSLTMLSVLGAGVGLLYRRRRANRS